MFVWEKTVVFAREKQLAILQGHFACVMRIAVAVATKGLIRPESFEE